MANFQRSTWATFLFVGLLAPFAIVAALMLLSPAKEGGTRAGDGEGSAATATGAATGSAPAEGKGGGMVMPPARVSPPLFAAGDERTLWVAHPMVDASDKKKAGFELLARSSNVRTWTLIRDEKGDPVFNGFPRGLAARSAAKGSKLAAAPYLFFEGGRFVLFRTEGHELLPSLPAEHVLLGTTGSESGIFAITSGEPAASTTRPGDVLDVTGSLLKDLETEPATMAAGTQGAGTQAATGSRPAASSRPATMAKAVERVFYINAYWFHGSHWTMLPALGRAGAGGSPEMPSPPSRSALVGMACQENRLCVMWVEPTAPRVLLARSLDFHEKGAEWSAVRETELGEAVPANSRLLPVVLDDSLYLFWPVEVGTGGLELHGGRMLTNGGATGKDLTLPAGNFFPVMSLKGAGDGLNAGSDVALGPAENSIAVVVNTKENKLVSFLFNNHGGMESGATGVEPASPRRDVEFAQNIALLLLVLMLTLSFWQWRQRPGELKLPAGMVVAKAGLRAGAFLIDMAIAYLVVVVAFGLWEDEGYMKIFSTGGPSVFSREVLWMLGLYLGHVTLGELFFRRSIGKAIMGLQVVMVDGKAPTVGAILVRNLIRLPELLLGIVFIYMLVSPYNQRLGDLIGKTLVISHRAPGGTGGSEGSEPPAGS